MSELTIGKPARAAGVETLRLREHRGLRRRIESAPARLADACPGSGRLDGCAILEAIEEPPAGRR